MPDTRAEQIAALEARLAELRSAPDPEPEPEPAPMYGVSLHPDEAAAGVLASGHAAGGHSGLAAGVSN